MRQVVRCQILFFVRRRYALEDNIGKFLFWHYFTCWLSYFSTSLFITSSLISACWRKLIVSLSSWYLFSQTTRFIPEFIIIFAQTKHGVILQYRVAPSREMPFFAA